MYEDGPPLDTNFKFTVALPEFPNVEAPVGGQTKIDASVQRRDDDASRGT